MNPLKGKLKDFPNSPGVYTFKAKGKILYVGMSKNLRSRVGSYFTRGDKRSKIHIMMDFVDDVEYIETDTQLLAKILEYNMIRELQPIYNSQYKKEKALYYLLISKDEELLKIDKDQGLGPFYGRRFLSNFMENISRILPIYYGEDGYYFSYNIFKRRLGQDDILASYRSITRILSSKEELASFTRALEAGMEESSKKLHFERSAFYLTLIRQVSYIGRNLFDKKEFLEKSYIFKDKEYYSYIDKGHLVYWAKGQAIDDFKENALKARQDFDQTYDYALKSIVFAEFLSEEIEAFEIE